MWEQLPTDTFTRALKKWPKKHKRELGAMLANVQTIFDALRIGSKVESLRFGFIHPEPGGVLAVDQKGGGSGLKQCRLYTYPHTPSETLHLVTLGDKGTQADDIRYARAFIEGVKSEGGEAKDDDVRPSEQSE